MRTFHRQQWSLKLADTVLHLKGTGDVDIHTLILKLTSSPSWLCVFKLGYQVLQKQLSQQLWFSGLQRERQKQFLTLGCSWLIFYLFDLKLTSLPHILIPVNRRVIEALQSSHWFKWGKSHRTCGRWIVKTVNLEMPLKCERMKLATVASLHSYFSIHVILIADR